LKKAISEKIVITEKYVGREILKLNTLWKRVITEK
jgi:hypothetical protein